MSGSRMSSLQSGLNVEPASAQFDASAASEAGVLRSNLANEEFIKWLPETMLAFAEQTGAGGFSFDLTYWEEGLPVASEYAQWSGWRNILAQLHTKPGCGGERCLVDNRQANHGWGAWMWAQGGSCALMLSHPLLLLCHDRTDTDTDSSALLQMLSR